jgi:signal transduction histidine kinase
MASHRTANMPGMSFAMGLDAQPAALSMPKMRELLMTDQERRTQGRLTALAYLCVVAALLVVVLLGTWGAYRDINLNRTTILETTVARLRPQAAETAWQIGSALEHIGSDQLSQLATDDWFQRYWEGVSRLKSQQLYAAVIDAQGKIVFHSDPAFIGRNISRRWYDRVVREVGNDVVEIEKNVLAGGESSFDVRSPILVDGNEIGGYHEGLSMVGIADAAAEERARIIRQWLIVVGAELLAVGIALAALYYIASRSVALRKAVGMAHLQRVTEVGQLAAGLAHEIRNPLHTLRLNLHTLRRISEGKAQLEDDEIIALTSESQEEIDRVDQLMRELLGFANPETARDEDVDVREEVQATLDFLDQELQRSRINVETSIPDRPVVVHMDPNRVRQVMLNLVLNAKEALRQGGELAVRVKRDRDEARIIVADNGPGVLPQNRQRVFEPFFTTKSGGTGFGLAMVKRYVTEAGGSVLCESNNGRGTKFQIRLPIATPSSGKD